MTCPHGRQRSNCKECGGSGICDHGRRRSDCKECGGVSICEHGRVRSTCKECRGGGHVTILEATEVFELDEDEEWLFAAQAKIVAQALVVAARQP